MGLGGEATPTVQTTATRAGLAPALAQAQAQAPVRAGVTRAVILAPATAGLVAEAAPAQAALAEPARAVLVEPARVVETLLRILQPMAAIRQSETAPIMAPPRSRIQCPRPPRRVLVPRNEGLRELQGQTPVQVHPPRPWYRSPRT